MNLNRTTFAVAIAAAGAMGAANETSPPTTNLTMPTCTYAGTGASSPSLDARGLAVSYADPQTVALAGIDLFPRPKVGIRVGGGESKEFMLDAGIDVTFNVPILPLPALRLDGEVWGTASNFGSGNRGNALSLLGIQTFSFAYAGVGPTFYFQDQNGDRHSGFGAKLLAGLSLPTGGFYVEAGLFVGPSPLPIFFTVGQRF